jgi:hypothetical protein
MKEEFLDHDPDTPTEADLDAAYGSKYLSSGDIGDKRIRTKVLKVRKETLKGNDGRERLKFVLFFDIIDKPMVLNATNKNELVDKLGRVPANWIGAEVGLHVVPTQYGGKPTKGLRIRVFPKPSKSNPTATAAPSRNSQAATGAGWPAEPDPDRDFEETS